MPRWLNQVLKKDPELEASSINQRWEPRLVDECMKKTLPSRAGRVRQAFNACDTSRTGMIKVTDVRTVLNKMNLAMTDLQFEGVLSHFDQSGGKTDRRRCRRRVVVVPLIEWTHDESGVFQELSPPRTSRDSTCITILSRRTFRSFPTCPSVRPSCWSGARSTSILVADSPSFCVHFRWGHPVEQVSDVADAIVVDALAGDVLDV